MTIAIPYDLASRARHPHDSVVRVAGVPVGGRRFTVIARLCGVESPAQIAAGADAARAHGAHLLRGGGLETLRLLRAASERTGLPLVGEIPEAGDVDRMAPLVDAYQVGARDMRSSPLLAALGRQPKPVLLERAAEATVEELLRAAECVLAGGNEAVILCERGIRTFETAPRTTLDLDAVALLERRTHLPVLVDPSHGAGPRELVAPLARAAAAVGADGIVVAVHPDPDGACSDGARSLSPADFARLMAGLAPFVDAAGRTLA